MDIQELKESSEVQEYDDGSIRWTPKNRQGKKAGTYLQRPPQAAPLISKATARQMALRKTLLTEQVTEEAMQEAAADYIGEDHLAPHEALKIFQRRLADKFLKSGNVAAYKELMNAWNAMAKQTGIEGISVQDSQVVIVVADNYTADEAREMARMFPQYAKELIDNADWRGAEDVYDAVMEELENEGS